MTALQKKSENPIAHLSAEDIEIIGKELDTIRQEVRDSLGEDDAKYIRKVIDVQRKLELGSRAVLLVSMFPPAWVVGHGRPVGRQDPREHGDRAQHPARPVGLDARPEDPLHDVGVGHGQPGRAVEALAQRAAPHVHERDRQGQRPRLRHHARRRGPALAPALPGPAAVELHQRLLLRVRHRRLRPGARQEPGDEEAPRSNPEFRAARQAGAEEDPQPGDQGLPGPPAAVRARRSCRRWRPTSPPTSCATCGRTR